MRRKIDRLIMKIGRWCGYTVQRRHRAQRLGDVPAGAKLYVGCGEHELPDYVGCDIRPLPHVALVCRAWEVSSLCSGLSEIYSRHMMEHLTWAEVGLTLKDWHQALAEGGRVRIEVPNIRFAINQWLRAEWNEKTLEDKFSDARWGFAGFFGWQRQCDPTAADYENSYWDVHKSGFDAQVLEFCLKQAGFHDVQISHGSFTEEQMQRRQLPPGASDNCHLYAVATKAEMRVSRAA